MSDCEARGGHVYVKVRADENVRVCKDCGRAPVAAAPVAAAPVATAPVAAAPVELNEGDEGKE